MKFINEFIINKEKILVSFLETIDMLTTSIVIGILIGIPLGIFIIMNNKNNLFKIILSFVVNVIRSIPFMILIIMISPLTFLIVGVSYGTQASKVPLTLISIAMIIRVTEQTISSLPNNVSKLANSLGATKFQTIIHFYIKESLPSLILGITTVIISVLSYSTIMGIIAGGGLGDLALRYGLYEYNYELLIIIVIIIISLVQVIQVIGNLLANYFNKEKYKEENKR